MSILFLAMLFFAISNTVVSQDTTGFFYCSEAYCEEARRENPCPVKRNCSTVGFRTFLDPSQCNCCDYCFDYLKENDTCSVFSPQKPTEMCGPYLSCQPGKQENSETCQLMKVGPNNQAPDLNFCMTIRHQYMEADRNGTLGIVQFLPECDAGGRYAPRQCIPGSLCYCSNSEGERVFGQALPQDKQDCACARDVAVLQSYGFKGRMPHCLSNGDYDELQCVVRSCYCRSYPNLTYHPQNMTRLPCCKLQKNANNLCHKYTRHKLLLFQVDPSIHVYDPDTPLYYMRPCELKRAEAEIDIAEAALNKTLMIISDMVNCDVDGNYAAIQTDFDRQFCSHPLTGEVLENFSVTKISPEAKAMNCYCARARYLMSNSATGKPQCCKNGNYRKLQHIGPIWFCVDEYGRQNVSGTPIEVHEQFIERLPCYVKSENGIPVSEMGCLF